MQIALISDIHGNSLALEGVLSDIERERPDHVVCLGDVVAFGPQPTECLDLLREIECPVVMGNTDEALLHSPEKETAADERTRRLLDLLRWCSERLSDEDCDYISQFRPTVKMTLDGAEELLCFHGSPNSFNDVIVAATLDDELDTMLEGYDASMMAGGHTHKQFVRRYRSSTVINPGSVGMDTPFAAEYALLEVDGGSSRIELRHLPVSKERLAEVVEESGMPHAEWWMNPENG